MTHPGATSTERTQAINVAEALEQKDCVDCDGCACGVGIDLMKEVISLLLDSCATTTSNDRG